MGFLIEEISRRYLSAKNKEVIERYIERLME